jgi:hypothetical protein
MADDKDQSPQWTIANVLKELRAKAKPGEGVRAQVFLKDHIADDEVHKVVEDIVAKVKKRSAKGPLALGKIHRLAKSFSVTADPDTMAAIAESPAVKTILPAEVEDIYPKPVGRKAVE